METETRRNYPAPETVFTKSLLADIAHMADVAARTRKLRQKGFEATDVYNEVVCDILDRITTGETLQQIVDAGCSSKHPAFPDTSDPLAVRYALGKMCAAAAMRLFRSVEREVPIGDATAVMGEEVQGEQRDQTTEEKARGNDRQMTAIMSRKALHRGIHRADVYGVAESSRMAMKDNASRYFAETDAEVTSALLDSNWAPKSPNRADIWNRTFQGDSPADVLYGIKPGFDVEEWRQAQKYLMAVMGMNLPCSAHMLKTDGTGDQGASTYPAFFPYKPLVLTTTRSGRPDGVSKSQKVNCIHCRLHDPKNPFVIFAKKAHDEREQAKVDADETYVRVPYKMPPLGKNCPPGKVEHWRKVFTPGLLPEGSTDGDNMTLRRSLADFATFVKKARNEFWTREAEKMALRANYRLFLEEQDGVGTGVPQPLKVSNLDPNRPWRTIFPTEEDSAKEARRWSLMHGMVDSSLWDSFTITLANAKPGTDGTPYLPGVERWAEMETAMFTDWIHVSKTGNMVMDGVTGTFVNGLPGLLDWTRTKNDGRKVVKALIAMRHLFALSMAN